MHIRHNERGSWRSFLVHARAANVFDVQIQRGRFYLTPITDYLRAHTTKEEWLRNISRDQVEAELVHWKRTCGRLGLRLAKDADTG